MENREIKFRVWDVGAKEYNLGDWSISTETGKPRGKYGEVFEGLIAEQYTGLKDKNGTEIFEGDVYHQGDTSVRYVVIYKGSQFMGSQIGNKSTAGLNHLEGCIEVIGNIFENQENKNV